MTNEDMELLLSTLPAKVGKPPAFVIKMLEDFVERTKLSWKDRQAYLMNRGGKWRVEVSIDGFRTVASRNPLYAGQDGPYWAMAPEGPWTDIPPAGKPYAAKVGVRLTNHSEPTYGVAVFKDYYAGQMWDKFPSTMVAKCAEMLALRKALPGDFSGVYGDAEMEQIDKPKGRPPGVPNSKPVTQARPSTGSSGTSTATTTPGDGKLPAEPATDDDVMIAELAAIAACKTIDELKVYRAGTKDRLSGSVRLKLSPSWEARKQELQKSE